ncbi:MAG: hypothetical protein Kow00121_29050 [Elainellaceae cyanobacterium]
MDNLDTTQLEQLKAIGAYLYEIRQDQARTLEEIAAKTYIPLRLLKALEAGQEKVLPEPVFVQGFIRRYADALGIDGQALAQQFPIHAVIPPPEVLAENGSDAAYDPVPQPIAVMDAPASPRKVFSRRSSSPAYAPYLGAAAIAVAILGGLIFLFSRQPQPPEVATPPASEPDTAENSAPAPSSPIAAAPASGTAAPASPSSPVASPSPTTSPAPASTAASPSPRSNAPVALNVSLTDRSWLQVVVDGEVEFEGILEKGEQRNWTAQRQITVVAGNAGAVMVASNNQKAEAMGEAGLVEERTFTVANSTTAPAN